MVGEPPADAACPAGFDAAPANVSSKCFKITSHYYSSPMSCDCDHQNASVACPANAAEFGHLLSWYGSKGWLGLYWAPHDWGEGLMLNITTFFSNYQARCISGGAASPGIVQQMSAGLSIGILYNGGHPFLCTEMQKDGYIWPDRCSNQWVSAIAPCMCEYPTAGPSPSALDDLYRLEGREDAMLWKLNAVYLG